MDREIRELDRQEKQIIAEIKQRAKVAGKNDATVNTLAKQLVQVRQQRTKLVSAKAQVGAMGMHATTMASHVAAASAIGSVTETMKVANSSMDVKETTKIMTEFQRETEKADLKQEMMDDVLMDAEQVDRIHAFLHETGCDYVRLEGLPLGANPLALTCDALERVCARKNQRETATGWGIYFEQSDDFKVQVLQETDPALCHPDIRMTLDYPEDLAFFTAVYEGLYQGVPVRMREIIAWVNSHPEVKALNADLSEKYVAHFNSGQEGIQDDV